MAEGQKGEVPFSLALGSPFPPGRLEGCCDDGRMVHTMIQAEKQAQMMEQLRQLYRVKMDHLETYLEPVEPFEFYREIFTEGSFERKGCYDDLKVNGIALQI